MIALVSVLVAGAIGLAVATSLLLLGIDASRSADTLVDSLQAKVLVNSCIEEGLYQIKISTASAATGTLAFQNGSCQYAVINSGGSTRTVYATGTVLSVIRKARAAVNQVVPRVTLSSWQEIP